MRETVWDWRGLWNGLSRADRAALRIFFLFIAWYLGWSVAGWIYRYDFSEVLIPITFQEERIEPIREETIHYRTYLIEAPVRQAFEVNGADLLVPRWQSFVTGWLAIVLGWAALLTAASRAEGFLSYLIYFAWAAWVALGGSARAWAGTDPFYVVSLGLSLIVLLPVYLIGAGLWRFRMGSTALLTAALVAVVLGLPVLWQGTLPLYEAIAAPAVIGYAIGGIIGLQIPVALLTLLIYPPVLRRQRMIGLWVLAGVAIASILLLVLLEIEAAYTLTVVLIVIGAGGAFIGLQPYYPLLNGTLRHPAAFFWGWGGLVLIALGTFGYQAWNHQDLYIYRAAELWRAILIGGVGGMFIYFLWNFLPLWRAGKMTYWDLARSTRFPLAAVYFLAVGGVLFSEARHDWPTTRLPARLYAVTRAEAALVGGRWEEAANLYREALYFLPYEAKINYNFARLEAQRREVAESAAERYERAILSKPFQPAVLQASVVWIALDRPVRALQTLQRYYYRFGGDGILCNQLGYAFYKVGQLDSAAFYWKEAIRQMPKHPQAYAHLALLYARYDKPSWATTVAQHISSWRDLPPAVQENLTYLHLRGFPIKGAFQGWNAQWLGMDTDTSAVGRFVQALHKSRLREAMGFIPYFRENDPELAPRLIRQVGIALLKAGSPRRAAEIFMEAGTPLDSLYAGYALAESGCWDAAYALISRLWGTYPELETIARREVVLLLSAAGRTQEVALLDPPQNWSHMDFLRFGYYAYLRREIQTMVLVLRPWIDAGATYDAPYEWVARLFLFQGDTSGAEENIQAGLARVPASVRLRLLQGELMWLQGKSAQASVDSAGRYLRTSEDTLLWESFQLRFEPRRAPEVLARFPYHIPALVLQARALLAANKPDEAHRLLSDALEVNPYAPELWAVYAETAEHLGMQEEAAFARKKPDPCPSAL